MKLNIRDIKKDLANRGGRKNTDFREILPLLPPCDVFVDIRHGVYDTTDGVLPFAVTTRIAASCQQWLLRYEEEKSDRRSKN